MDIVTRMLINKVKKSSRSDPTRQRACELIYQDLPTILKHDYDSFKKKLRNAEKDVVDFYFIKKYQQKQSMKKKPQDIPVKNHPKPRKDVNNSHNHQINQSETKSTVTIGELIKARN